MSTTPAFSTMSIARPSSSYTTTPKFSGSGTCLTKICASSDLAAHVRMSSLWAYSKMLSPSTQTSFPPAANCSAMPTTCAIPPASVCTRYVRSRSSSCSSPPRVCIRPSPSRSIIWPACRVPVTTRTSRTPASWSRRRGYRIIGQPATGSRCLLVTRASSPSRVASPPAQMRPLTCTSADAMPELYSARSVFRRVRGSGEAVGPEELAQLRVQRVARLDPELVAEPDDRGLVGSEEVEKTGQLPG